MLTSVHSPQDIRIFHKEARTLVKAGYPVVIVGPSETVQRDCDGIRIVPVSGSRSRLVRMSWTVACVFLRAIQQDATVYHIHDPELLPAALALKLLRGARIVYDVHENYQKALLSKTWVPSPLRRPLASLFGWYEKLACKAFDCIIAATDDIATSFRNRGLFVVRNYAMCTASAPLGDPPAPRPGRGVVVYAGGLTEADGIRLLVEAVGSVRSDYEVCLHLLGRPEKPAFVRELLETCNARRVRILGWIPAERVRNCLSAADIGVVCPLPQPNAISALPNKLFEYMEAGLPVIASDFPLWREIVVGEHCGIVVDPLRPDELTRAIEYLLERPELRLEMGRNGRRAVVEKYNWERESRALLRAYEELVTP
jgi:glycosyltransferase involved in cell wall biosynthesis